MLSVSFISVNRWDNNKYAPTKIIKVKLAQLFEDNDIITVEDFLKSNSMSKDCQVYSVNNRISCISDSSLLSELKELL